MKSPVDKGATARQISLFVLPKCFAVFMPSLGAIALVWACVYFARTCSRVGQQSQQLQQVSRERDIYRALFSAQKQGAITPEQLVQTIQSLQQQGRLSP